MKVLILGHNGMLGHMVKYYLEKFYDIETIQHRWPNLEFKDAVSKSDSNYLINCIGAIPQKKDIFDVNFDLPVWLDQNFCGRVIHPDTDCRDSDPYCISKNKSSEWILSEGNRTKIIKSSILGPELNNRVSLMEWFLSNEDGSTVDGYTRYFWNGNTTLTWAEFSRELINKWEKYEVETVLSSVCITKKEILESINEIFDRKINILSKEGEDFNLCLTGQISTQHIKIQLKKLKEFYYDTQSGS